MITLFYMYGMKEILLGTKLYSEMFIWNKSLMFIGKYVAKLIADTWSRADDFINKNDHISSNLFHYP